MMIFVLLIVVVIGAMLLRWNDLFHLVVALPLMGAAALLVLRFASAASDDDVSGEPEEEPIAVRLLRGALTGALFVAVGAVGLAVASRSPLHGWFYDRDVEKVAEHVQVLSHAGNFDEAVHLIDERVGGPLSRNARRRLEALKVRALLQSADQRGGQERIDRLREALRGVGVLGSPELRELVEAKLRAGESEDLLARVELAVKESTRGMVVTLPDVLFASGSDRLVGSASAQLHQIVTLLNAPDHVARRVSIEGSTDTTGGEQVNQQLSARRASAVSEALAAGGVDPRRLSAKGLGSSRPIASNDNPEGRAKNRRVEVVLLSDEMGRVSEAGRTATTGGR